MAIPMWTGRRFRISGFAGEFPAGRGYTALIREFSGLTDPIRRHFREEVLAVDPERLQETARRYFPPASETAVVAVCAPEERLRKANEVLEEKLEIEKLI